MHEVELRIRKNGVDQEPQDLTLSAMLVGVCNDLEAKGVLILEHTDGVSYLVPVITFATGTTHTYVAGPAMSVKMQRIAASLASGLAPFDALKQLAVDLDDYLDAGSTARLRDGSLDTFANIVVRWMTGDIEGAFELLLQQNLPTRP